MTMPAAGGDPQILLADEFDNLSPAWRPDNRHVLFLSNRGGRGRSGCLGDRCGRWFSEAADIRDQSA